MSLVAAPRRRSLVRSAAAGAVVVVSGLLGAPAASAAEDGRPVIALDPPDVAFLLVPQENLGMLDWTEGMASAEGEGEGEGSAAAALGGAGAEPPTGSATALLPGIAALLPPQVAAALPPEVTPPPGAGGGLTTQTHGHHAGVHVLHGGTLHLRLPALVDASSAVFRLDVDAQEPDGPPRGYSTHPLPSDEPLTVAPSGDDAFAVTLPGEVHSYGPAATLTVDGLTDAGTGAELVEPLAYGLEFLPTAPATVTLEPVLAVISHAQCSVTAEVSCPGPTVRAGRPLDLTVPPDSLLTVLGLGRLDTAYYLLASMDGEGPYQYYDSEVDPELVTVHGRRAATLHVPADARPAPYLGLVLTADPAVGVAATIFEFDVASVPVNPGLRSDTGWVEEVRNVSPGSTAAVAGGALLLVGGLVTAAAVRPGRRPPLGG